MFESFKLVSFIPTKFTLFHILRSAQLERLKIEYFLFKRWFVVFFFFSFLWEIDKTQSWPAISHTFDLMDSPGPFSIRREMLERDSTLLLLLFFLHFCSSRSSCLVLSVHCLACSVTMVIRCTARRGKKFTCYRNFGI